MTRNRLQALSIAAFPVLLVIGILTIPVVSDYADHALTEKAAGRTARWYGGHVISAIAFGFGALASCAIANYIEQRGEGPDNIGKSLAVVGAALFAAGLGADGVGPVAVAAGGGQARAFFDGSGMLVSSLFIAASITFGAGMIIQVVRVIRTGALVGISRVVVFTSALVFVGSTAIPSGWGLYAVAAAALGVYLPIGIAVWQDDISQEKVSHTEAS